MAFSFSLGPRGVGSSDPGSILGGGVLGGGADKTLEALSGGGTGMLEQRRREAELQAKEMARTREAIQAAMSPERRAALRQEVEAARRRALAEGRARGQQVFGGQFGARGAEERQAEFQNVLEQRRAQLQGLTPEEQAAMRTQVLGGIGRQEQSSLRQLRGVQGQTGLRGGAAAAQQANVLRTGQEQRAAAERDIFLQQIGAKRQALDAFQQTVAEEQDRAQREIQGKLATEFGFGSLGAAESSGIAQMQIGEAQSLAGQQFAAQAGRKK